MRGRVHAEVSKEEKGLDVRKSMKDTSPSEKRIVKGAAKEKSHMRRESGICNLCSAPCSSCMHLNQSASLMESKVEGESSNDAGRLHLFKSRAYDDGQHSASEASNFLSTTSSHDSLTENAQSKETKRGHDVPEGSEDGLECHGDNISCVTGNKEESWYCLANKEKRSSVAVSKTADVSFKSDFDNTVFPSSNDVYSCPPECYTEQDDILLAGKATSKKVNAHECAPECINIDPATKVCEAGLIKCSSSVSLETEGNKDVLAPLKLLTCTDVIQQSGKSTTSFEVSNVQEPQAKSLPVSDCENSGPDMTEDDVKVCDICGDTGREDLLAICSRCSDGAEHTYCMRIMLDKVPEGDWLCEECQLKEDAENHRAAEAERKLAAVKVPPLNEKNKKNVEVFIPKPISKLDTKALEQEGIQAVKVAISPKLPAKRLPDNLEVSVSKRPAIEMGTKSPSTGSPTKRPALTRESSFMKSDVGKIKVTHMPPSPASHSRNNSQESVRSAAVLGANSSMTQVLPQSPRGLLSRSVSFNNSRPKLKQIVEEVTQKKKMEKESSISGTRKMGLKQTISRSLSFKPVSSSTSSANMSRSRSLNFSHPDDARGSKQTKEHNVMERKNLSKLDCSTVSSSQLANPRNLFRATSMPHSSNNNSRDSKTMNPSRKLSALSDPTSSISKKGSENLSPPVKKQFSKLSSGSVISSNGRCHSQETERSPFDSNDLKTTSSSVEDDQLGSSKDRPLCDGLLQQESTNSNGKVKEPFSLSSSGSNVLSRSGNKCIRCQRCNEVGHAAEFCTAVSHSVSKSLRETTNKSRLKCAVEVVISRTKMHKDNRLADHHDLPLLSPGFSNDIASKDQLKSSSYSISFSSPGGTLDEQEAFRSSSADFHCATAAPTDTITDKQLAIDPEETAAVARDNNMADTSVSDESKTKHFKLNPPSQASVVAKPLRISAIPECDYIWQGDFDVQRSGRGPELYGGIQAHLSTLASPKVLEVVKKFPLKLYLEEVPRMSAWPTQFEGSCASEDNIALYFFARDLDSYEKHYKKLLGNIVKNDFALKGNINGIELLIFPSSQLPLKSQCWNRFLFLWAVFRIRNESSSRLNYDTQNNLFSAKSEIEHHLPTVLISEVAASKFSKGHVDEELFETATTPRALEASNSSLPSASSSMKENGQTSVVGMSLDQKSSMHEFKELTVDESHSSERTSAHEHKDCLVDGIRSTEKRTSCFYSSGDRVGNIYGEGPTHKQTHAFLEPNESMVHETHSVKNASHSFLHFHPSSSSSHLISSNETCSTARIPMRNLQWHSALYNKCISLKECSKETQNGADLEMESFVQEDVPGVHSDSKSIQTCMEISNLGQAGLAADLLNNQETLLLSSKMPPVTDHTPEVVVTGSKDGGKERVVDIGNPSEVDVRREQITPKEDILNIKSGRKCPSNLVETIPETSGDTKVMIPESLGKYGMIDFVLVDGDEGKKRRAICSQEQDLENRSSPEILEVDSGILDEELNGHCADNGITVTSKNVKMAERYSFPVKSGPVRDLISGNSIPLQILSSDDEGPPETDFPNLELALGSVRKRQKQGILPLFVPAVDEGNNQSKLSDLMLAGGDDDMLPSLSLSLAFPSFDK